MSQHPTVPRRTEDPLSAYDRDQTNGKGPVPSGRIDIPEAISQTAYAVMVGLIAGQVPLKVARAAYDLGNLSLRGAVVSAEYGLGQPLQLPDTRGKVTDETRGTARGA